MSYRAIITCDYPDLGIIECQIYDVGRPVWREPMACYFKEMAPIFAALDRLNQAGMIWNYDEVNGRLDDCYHECRVSARKGMAIWDRIMEGILGEPSDED